MPIAVLGSNGKIQVPEGFAQRREFREGQEWWVDQREGALILLPRRSDLRKLYIEPTTVCNLTCRTCIRNVWEDPHSHMEMEVFRQLLEQTHALPELQRVVFSGLGEPLAHPQFLDMVRLVREKGIAVTIGSNGLLLGRDVSRALVELGVDRLVLSLDGVTSATYAGVRGATMSRVLEHIRWLNEEKRRLGSLTPTLGIEFVALRSNIAELADLTGLASHLNASRVLVSNVLAYTDEMREEILYGYEPRAPLSAGSWPIKTDSWVLLGVLDLPRMHWGAEPRCRFVQDRASVICWNGMVTPCYALAHNYSYLTIDGRRKQVSQYTFGDIRKQSLVEIWTSEDYCHFRNEVRDFRFPSCPDCDLRATCDLRERNEGCWGWNPSCGDCLWAQDIVRCP